MNASAKPRVVGFNHVALEVRDIEEALAFYSRLFEFKLRGKSDTMAFIDLGDQFVALQKGRKQPPDDARHLGLVVDNKEAARTALDAAGMTPRMAQSDPLDRALADLEAVVLKQLHPRQSERLIGGKVDDGALQRP